MTYVQSTQIGGEQGTRYATIEDFRDVFTKDTNGLYQFSLLLTADRVKAEQCFVDGLEECIDGNPVFRHWAHSWAKRAILNNAIRALRPTPAYVEHPSKRRHATDVGKLPTAEHAKVQVARVLALGDFERFVFVMTVLERYSDRECALLLNCSADEIRKARADALASTAAVASALETRGGVSSPFNEPGSVVVQAY